MIKILFFAQLRELLNTHEVKLDNAAPCSVAKIKQILIESHPQWARFLDNTSILTAVNQAMVSDEYIVNSLDEVAFFPPVTGG